jgi:hypothetical protein
MNLHRSIVMQEMTGPIPFELTLGEVIRDGDTTNHYQIYVLALISRMFKDGYSSNGGPMDLPPVGSDATSTKVIDSIKSLTPAEKVNLATYLLGCITAGSSALHSTEMSSEDWVKYVLQRQN